MKAKNILILVILVISSIFIVSSTEDYNGIHCDYYDFISGYYCTDGNQWESMDGLVTQDMRNYYEGVQNLNYIVPQTYPETWTVSNMSP